MALATTNGMTISDDMGSAPNGPGLAQQLGNQVDEFYGAKSSDIGALPAAGKFLGQRRWLVDAKGWAVWNGSAWISDTPWATPTMSNSWAAYNDATGAYEQPAYRRDGGEVKCRGRIKAGTAATIFSFPLGFRPLKTRRFLVPAGAGVATVEVTNTGVVTLVAYLTGGGNASVDLEAIRFEPGV